MPQGVFYTKNQWFDENPALIGPMDHAFWMSSVVFDGARSIHGLVPDLGLHCERLIHSAAVMNLAPTLNAKEIEALCLEAVRKLPPDIDLYIRPAFYAEEGFINPDPESTRFVLAVYEAPVPPFKGFSIGVSTRRRPARDMAPTDAKAACLYPNSARALREIEARGFDNALILDPNGNVAELATANVWYAKDDIAYTPMANGTFLAGITRDRVMGQLRDAGTEVVEAAVSVEDVLNADEIFSTGNYSKVSPIIRIEDRELQPGPITQKAYALYMDYAKGFSAF
jgi:branched-chain amino acid aminotransferase